MLSSNTLALYERLLLQTLWADFDIFNEVPTCECCQKKLTLMAEIDSTYDPAFDRVLAVFACLNNEKTIPCHVTGKGWKAFRFLRMKRREEENVEEEVDEQLEGQTVNFGGESTEPAPSAVDMLAQTLACLSLEPKTAAVEPEKKSGKPRRKEVSNKLVGEEEQETIVLPRHQVEIQAQPEGLEDGFLDSLSVRSVELASKMATGAFNEEEEDSDGEEDKWAVKLEKRLRVAPEQIIRYCVGGEPLWIATPNERTHPELYKLVAAQERYGPAANVTPCPRCKSPRKFECQLLSTLTSLLATESTTEEGIEGKEEKERKEGKRNMFWGTAVIYTCSQDCWIDDTTPIDFAQESIWVQSI